MPKRRPRWTVAEDDDYVEVEAVIRMPRGERLADSKKTEGWSRGFTPKSTGKGPEHVEIRLKDEDEDLGLGRGPAPQFSFINEDKEDTGQRSEKTREQQELEELVGALVLLGLVKAAEWTQPRLRRLWNEHLAPFLNARMDGFKARRDQKQDRKAHQRAGKNVTAEATTPVTDAMPVYEGVKDALQAYETNMTSAEARQHFAEALVAQRFAEEKVRLLATARIKDNGLPTELSGAIKSLTPMQVANALDSLLASRPTLIDDLEQFLESGRKEGQLQLGSERTKAVLRLTGNGKS